MGQGYGRIDQKEKEGIPVKRVLIFLLTVILALE
jgi:hypothetical protein